MKTKLSFRKSARLIAALLFTSLFLTTSNSFAKKPDTRWFEEARFGMFIHFGPYSVLGDGEWVMNLRPIRAVDYLQLQNLFNPHAFDARKWVQTAKNAGMKYITFTSRHHDGFSNWDTKQSDWNIMNTPYGKDLIRQLADECQKEGIKLMLYYSTLDWMRSDYQYETGQSGKHSGRTEKSDWDSYIRFMKAQLTELLTNYGPIAGIWFDGHWDQTTENNRTTHDTFVDWHYPEIYGLIRRLQPECLITNNHHLPPIEGEDYQVFERDAPGENKSGYSGQAISNLPLETCETMNWSWGYKITDPWFKSTAELIHLLVRSAGHGANLLLNVGPMPNGQFPPECVKRLQEVGEWMQRYGHTIYGTRQGCVPPQTWGAVTAKGKTQYIHILDKETKTITLDIPGFRSARWLHDGSKATWTRDKKSGAVTFAVNNLPDEPDVILEVETK